MFMGLPNTLDKSNSYLIEKCLPNLSLELFSAKFLGLKPQQGKQTLRCYICDWTPRGEPSLYHETLELYPEDDTPPPPRRILQTNDGKTICSHCHQSSESANEEWNSRRINGVTDHEEMEELV